MKNKIFVLALIFLEFSLQLFPVFATDLNSLKVWSDTSNLVLETASEPTFDIKSESGILIEVTTRKSFI